MLRYVCFVGLVFCVAFAGTAAAKDEEPDSSTDGRANTEDIEQFGGPKSVGGQLKEDLKDRDLPSLRERLMEEHGFSYSINYAALYQTANKSLGDDEAASGIFQLPISWTLTGRESGNTGTLVFNLESRDAFLDVAPQDFGFVTGAASVPGTAFSDTGLFLSNLYWSQTFKQGRQKLAIGRVALTDFLDAYGMFNPQTAFGNLSFLLSPTIASPAEGLGAAYGAMMNDNWYVVGTFGDANAISTRSGFDSFDTGELFKSIEIGWTTAPDRIYFDNVHVTLWHTDERVNAGVSEGSGATFSFAWFLDDRLMPFVRLGASDGGAGALQEASAAVGLGWYRPNRDLFGVGLAWGQPSEADDGFRSRNSGPVDFRNVLPVAGRRRLRRHSGSPGHRQSGAQSGRERDRYLRSTNSTEPVGDQLEMVMRYPTFRDRFLLEERCARFN